jgi:TetR/AcrR family transcriptional repressor of bet genes
MGRKPNTELRRQQIADALLAELSTVGFERASIKSIAERAGLAPGLVHYHFKNKEEILLVLLDELIGQAERRYAELAASADSPVHTLRAFITARVGMGTGSDSKQVRAWVSIIGEAIGQKTVRRRVGKWLEASHAELSKLFAQAGVAMPEEHAAMLLAMILGSFSMHAVRVAGVPGGYAESGMLRWLEGVTGARAD